MTLIIKDDELYHFGVLRKSGRYPWGSGANPEQRSRTFTRMADELKAQGLSEAEIAKGLGLDSTTDLRAVRSLAKNQIKAAETSMAIRLKEKGLSNMAIGEKMGKNESSVRALLKGYAEDAHDRLMNIANMLKEEVAKHGFLDVGTGVEHLIGVSETRLKTAVAMLKDQGYVVHTVQVDQLGTSQKTSIKVLAPEGTTYRDIVSNMDKIGTVAHYTEDNGRSILGLERPKPFSSKRLAINYAEDGGSDADGTMYLRRGVKDLSLGGANYAQVRINVDDTHYIKGMAIYKDDLPDGVDVVFNTNKNNKGDKLAALKPLKSGPDGSVDWDNPFGAVISRQSGVLNILNEEGDWDKWSKSLSSQMLSKQPNSLAKEQLDLKYKSKKEEFDEIMSLTNPTVRRTMLEKFAEDADSSAVHLKAAGLSGQRTQVILPMNSMKETEIYAPNFPNGERVVLVRFPHGGRFEMPELTVNNRNPKAKSIMGNAKDAVGINAKVAQRLSGADFDGDTVLVIPNPHQKVKTAPPLKELEGFDPQTAYKGYEGMPKTTDREKQRLMGEVSNLITDMTIRGAPQSDIARAVRHSMVVIDAEKHNLNWRQSAKDNGINDLKEKYQGRGATGRLSGASTIVSRAQSDVRVPERKERAASRGGRVDPATGKLVYEPTGASYTKTTVSKTGKVKTETVIKTTKSKALAEVDDAFKLSSGTPMEAIYATHSNRMKDLANAARKASIETPSQKRNAAAAKAYAPEVERLKAALTVAQRNAPLERKAQILGNAVVKQKKQANPDMSAADLKKIKGQALNEARSRTGARKERIVISPREWEAIQAGAVSENLLSQILRNANAEQVKELATPRTRTVMTDAKIARAKAMLAAGHTQADVAAALGVPVSTLHDAV